MFGIGIPELLLIFSVALFFIGANRVVDIAKGLGKAIKGFSAALDDFDSTKDCSREENLEKIIILRKFIASITVIVLTVACAVTVAWAQNNSKDKTDEWDAPMRAAQKKNPDEQEKSIVLGKAVYNRECIFCHGVTGRGDGSMAKSLDQTPTNLSDPKILNETDGALFWKITEGHRPMPTFKSHLSEDEVWHVINYLRTLAQRDTGEKQPSQ